MNCYDKKKMSQTYMWVQVQCLKIWYFSVVQEDYDKLVSDRRRIRHESTVSQLVSGFSRRIFLSIEFERECRIWNWLFNRIPLLLVECWAGFQLQGCGADFVLKEWYLEEIRKIHLFCSCGKYVRKRIYSRIRTRRSSSNIIYVFLLLNLEMFFLTIFLGTPCMFTKLYNQI